MYGDGDARNDRAASVHRYADDIEAERSHVDATAAAERQVAMLPPMTASSRISSFAALRRYVDRVRTIFTNVKPTHQQFRERHDSAQEEEEMLLRTMDSTGVNTIPPQLISPPITHNAKARPTAHLDGLRGLAAFIVFVNHWMHWFAGGEDGRNLNDLGFYQDGDPNNTYFCTLPFIRLFYSGGTASVLIFFVLSGYVLSIGPLTKMKRSDGNTAGQIAIRQSLAGAVVRRPFRLYLPPAIIALPVALLWHVPGLVQQVAPKPTIWAELLHWWNAVVVKSLPWMGGPDNWYLPPSWTLYKELIGSFWTYLIVFIGSFFLTATSRSRAAVFAGALGVTAIYMLHNGLEWAIPPFLLGIMLATINTWSLDTILTERMPKRIHNLTNHVLLFCGLYLLSQPTFSYEASLGTPGWHTLTTLLPEDYKNEQKYLMYWLAWGALLVVYSTLRINWMKTFFLRRSLQYLGKVSFMLYLVHLPCMVIYLNKFHEMLGGVDLPSGEPRPGRNLWYHDLLWIPNIGPLGLNTRFLAGMVVAVPTTLALADVLTRRVDAPSIVFAEKVAACMGLGKKESSKIPAGDARETVLLPLNNIRGDP